MKRDYLPRWLQQTLLGCLAVIFVLLPFHAFISTWGGAEIGPLWLWKVWKEILLSALIVPVVVCLSLRPRRWAVVARDKLFWLILAFAGLVITGGVYYSTINGHDATAAGITMSLRYLLIFGLGYVLIRFGQLNWPDIRKKAAQYLIAAGTLVAVLGILQVTVIPADFLSSFGYDKQATIAPYVLIDENPDALRAFATLRGPNDFGAYLILPLILSLLFARKNKWFLAASMTMLVGIFASGSRSAWVGAAVSLGVLAVLTFGTRVLRSRKAIGAVIAGIILLCSVAIAAVSIPAVRLAVFHSSPGDSSLTEGSTDKHWEATAQGVGRVIEQPLGCGAGCAGPASYYSDAAKISENYYIQIAEETGVVGLILWIGLVVIMAGRLWHQRADWMAQALFASFIGVSVIGFWLHVWSDDPLSLTWWLLAGLILGQYASASSKKAVS